MADIRLQKLHKRFADFIAVHDVDMKINSGHFFVLLGPSGCGKTTTLRMIAGLELPTSGHIYIDEEDVTNLRASRRDIAFVFQLFALYQMDSGKFSVAGENKDLTQTTAYLGAKGTL